MTTAQDQRYLDKVDMQGLDDCWPWKAWCNPGGYGVFRGNGEQLAHRHGYRMHFGDIPEGLIVCHTCDNPPCQNPNHWFLGTHADNSADKMAKGRFKPGGAKGESNPFARLTVEDVERIKAAYIGGATQQSIAQQFGVGQQLISKLVRSAAWKHVAAPMEYARPSRGETHHDAKITQEVADTIRREYAAGGVFQKDLASKYGIAQSGISKILSNKSWVRST